MLELILFDSGALAWVTCSAFLVFRDCLFLKDTTHVIVYICAIDHI